MRTRAARTATERAATVFRIDPALRAALDRMSLETTVTRTQILELALAAHLKRRGYWSDERADMAAQGRVDAVPVKSSERKDSLVVSVWLESWMHQGLAQLAIRKGTTMSAILREHVLVLLKKAGYTPPPLDALPVPTEEVLAHEAPAPRRASSSPPPDSAPGSNARKSAKGMKSSSASGKAKKVPRSGG